MDENLEQPKTKEEILSQFEQRDGKYVHKLTEPIKFGEETITEFVLQKPKAKHIVIGTPNVSNNSIKSIL